jgi:hypothetical protein
MMRPDFEETFGQVLAGLTAAETTLRDVEGYLERLERAVVNLAYYAACVEGLPSRSEWDVVKQTLGAMADGKLDD